MSSDDNRLSSERLLELAELAHIDSLQGWPEAPWGANDVGARALQSATFGQLTVIPTYGTEVLLGEDIVESQRHQPDDQGMVPIIDLAKAGFSRVKAEAAALALWTAARQSIPDDALLAELVTSIIQQDAELALAAGWSGDDLDSLLEAIDAAGASLLGDDGGEDAGSTALVDRFVVPPFSVLDTRQGYWQDRKRSWLNLGIRSEVGREGALAYNAKASDPVSQKLGEISGGTSVFDPVLCEIAYRWFTPGPGSLILDPFAGGVVRGAVAARLGHRYTGIELRPEQVVANTGQGFLWSDAGYPDPSWITGDSRDIASLAGGGDPFDLLFTCPPYADLEVYSDDPADLSTLDPREFLGVHASIIKAACGLLADNRFAVWVVSEVRDSKRKGGPYIGFVPATIRALEEAGLCLYNEAVLINSVGTIRMRAAKQFVGGRKLGRIHQNVIVAYKGDPSKIAKLFPELGSDQIGDPGDDEAA